MNTNTTNTAVTLTFFSLGDFLAELKRREFGLHADRRRVLGALCRPRATPQREPGQGKRDRLRTPGRQRPDRPARRIPSRTGWARHLWPVEVRPREQAADTCTISGRRHLHCTQVQVYPTGCGRLMAIVVGIVSQEDRVQIVRAGYTLAGHPAVLSLLKDMQPFGAIEEEAVAVWVDCDVTDLLVLDDSERTIKVAAGDVRKVAARMGSTLADDKAARIAAQVAAHLREVIEDEIEHALDTQ